jgi:hypothetical protein
VNPSNVPQTQTILSELPGPSLTEEMALLKSQIGMSGPGGTDSKMTFADAAPHHLFDLIYWQWTVTHPSSVSPTLPPVRPPAPSPTEPVAKGQQMLPHHHLDPAPPGLDPLVSIS